LNASPTRGAAVSTTVRPASSRRTPINTRKPEACRGGRDGSHAGREQLTTTPQWTEEVNQPPTLPGPQQAGGAHTQRHTQTKTHTHSTCMTSMAIPMLCRPPVVQSCLAMRMMPHTKTATSHRLATISAGTHGGTQRQGEQGDSRVSDW
jgi:hypothetical protein